MKSPSGIPGDVLLAQHIEEIKKGMIGLRKDTLLGSHYLLILGDQDGVLLGVDMFQEVAAQDLMRIEGGDRLLGDEDLDHPLTSHAIGQGHPVGGVLQDAIIVGGHPLEDIIEGQDLSVEIDGHIADELCF